MTKRVIECNICGEPLSAANDDELFRQVKQHLQAEHPDSAFDEDRAREMISREAYDAGDA